MDTLSDQVKKEILSSYSKDPLTNVGIEFNLSRNLHCNIQDIIKVSA